MSGFIPLFPESVAKASLRMSDSDYTLTMFLWIGSDCRFYWTYNGGTQALITRSGRPEPGYDSFRSAIMDMELSHGSLFTLTEKARVVQQTQEPV
jgi:hypothetical protein